jgi:EgtB-related family protein
LQACELAFPGGAHRLGSGGGDGFAFDNELQAADHEVAPFRIDAEPMSWARFLPFVEAGGYEDPQWWDTEGLGWLRAQPRAPRHLRLGAAGWEQALGGTWLPLDPSRAAIHLSAHEAEAWCRWAGRRLPTELEWEAAAMALPGFRWGAAWEWTASPFAPYLGFVPHPYRDYSQPWFQGRRVLRGACSATSPWLAHARYRNFFAPQRTDILAGFRSCL